MRKLFFITSYNSDKSGRNLKCVPSSLTYNRYLINAFEKIPNTTVEVLSSSISRDKVYWTKKTALNNKHKEIYFKSIPSKWGNWAVRLSLLWLYIQLFYFLFTKAKKDDIVIIYHGHGLSRFYKFYRRFIHCKFVFVVGEIFSAVWDLGVDSIKKECSYLKKADGYIFSNDIMPRLFKAEDISLVCYGNYEYSKTSKVENDKVHVLYAGKVSSKIINDAFVALDVINYLPKCYVMHIAGYGEEKDIEKLNRRIEEINSRAGDIVVTYEGNLSGTEYEDLLAKCRIGLCTRTLRNELSNYCFPSKTLVYLTHDILPICPMIDNLLECKLAERVSFIQGELTPENIAKTILKESERLHNYDNEAIIKKIDEDFIVALKSLFESI